MRLATMTRLHAPAHNPVDDMRAHCHYVMRARRSSRSVRVTSRGRYNRFQYVALRLMERAGRIDAEEASILARIRAIA